MTYPDKLFFQNLKQFRRELHQYPEVSGKEFETAKTISTAFKLLQPDILLEELGGTGVLATFSGTQPGPHLMFRAELDALPIQELNSFPHRSTKEGVSHKCGHDGHMATLFGLAQWVAAHRPQQGQISVLFQPAEEDGSGAAKVLADERFITVSPDYVFAFHNLPGYDLGQVVIRDGSISAAVRSMIIKLKGKTAHAAEPENGINPAPALAALIIGLQTLMEPDTSHSEFKLITPVHMNLGEKAYGVAAGYGELHLTIRTWTEPVMLSLITQINSLIDKVSNLHGLDSELDWTDSFLANQNDIYCTGMVRKAAEYLNMDISERQFPLKWGEDFGYFTQKYPGAFWGMGAGLDSPALHNPDYDYPDELSQKALMLFLKLIQDMGLELGHSE